MKLRSEEENHFREVWKIKTSFSGLKMKKRFKLIRIKPVNPSHSISIANDLSFSGESAKLPFDISSE